MIHPTRNKRATGERSLTGLGGDVATLATDPLDSILDRHPDLWWLRSNPQLVAAGGEGNIRTVFSPDYFANRYQRNLYRVSREYGHQFKALSAERVLALPDSLFSGRLAPVFHQHWLKEIFSGRQADAAGLQWVNSYFNSLRNFQSRGGKVLWTVHNLFDHDLSSGEKQLNLHCLEQMAGLADVILVHARDAATELEKIVGFEIADRVELLRHPLYDSMHDSPQFLPIELRAKETFPPGLRFLMFGLIRPYKGATDLLRAFKSLVEAGELQECSLIIAGRVHDPELQHMVGQLGELDRSVLMIDRRVSDTELASLCREADVGVLPYRKILTSGSYYQALTFGLPCVVPDIGMFQSEVEDGVTGIKYSGSDGLQLALQRAHALGRDQLAAMGKRALGQCSAQTEREISRRFRTLLESTAGWSQAQEVKLSFCIPVMNRLDDLRATLARNLEDNRESKGRVEFIVVSFDPDDAVEQWIKQHFKAELEDEYLRFHQAEPLEYWHFGRAKNAFRELMRGRIYASLDGDNFTGYRGGEHIIEVFESHDYRCIFHQFQGEWGDGTCGRVSLSREDYLDFGYDEQFLPRQWDEMDAMLSTLVQRRDRKYVCYEGRSIIDKSHPFRRYLEEHEYSPPTVQMDPQSDPLYRAPEQKSVGVHDNDYVQDDPALRYSSVFNHLQSFFKNTDRDDLKIQYVNELVDVQRRLVETVDPSKLQRWLLQQQTAEPTNLGCSDIAALACVKNEVDLDAWYQHYKTLGVTRFLIIDDGSDIPVKDVLPHDDVHVWAPIAGKFRYSKAFWLEALLAKYCEGLWCLTIDADEFLSLPDFPEEPSAPASTLRRCLNVADSLAQEYFCGFLLDMVPEPRNNALVKPGKASFTHYQFLPGPPDEAYSSHNTARWSYGDKLDWAHAIDVRFRVNRSLDSLRKFPIVRWRPGIHLNQGFHDLIIDGVKRSHSDLQRTDLVPLLHFKLQNLSYTESKGISRGFDGYHYETRENLLALTQGIDEKILAAAESEAVFPYLGFSLIPIPSRKQIWLVRAGSESVMKDQDIMQRAVSLHFYQQQGGVEIIGHKVCATSFDVAIEWLRSQSPFCMVDERSDDHAVLSVMPYDTAGQPETPDAPAAEVVGFEPSDEV